MEGYFFDHECMQACFHWEKMPNAIDKALEKISLHVCGWTLPGILYLHFQEESCTVHQKILRQFDTKKLSMWSEIDRSHLDESEEDSLNQLWTRGSKQWLQEKRVGY